MGANTKRKQCALRNGTKDFVAQSYVTIQIQHIDIRDEVAIQYS